MKDEVGRDGDIEHADGVGIVVSTLLGGEAIPLAVDVEGEVVQGTGLVDLFALGLDDEVLFELTEQLLGGETIEVFHHAVVVDDGELACGEAYGHEVVVLLVATMVGVLTCLLGSYEGRCS